MAHNKSSPAAGPAKRPSSVLIIPKRIDLIISQSQQNQKQRNRPYYRRYGSGPDNDLELLSFNFKSPHSNNNNSSSSSSSSSCSSSMISYTSLKDLINVPSSYPSSSSSSSSPTPIVSASSSSSSYEISIRNRLVKQAAWAYLQPMSYGPSSSGPRLCSYFSGDFFFPLLRSAKQWLLRSAVRVSNWFADALWLLFCR